MATNTNVYNAPSLTATKMDNLTTTPTRSLIKMKVNITREQKQALIDNLQLEITERARKLRAQYALQSQSVRTRGEMRVNRIPMALRKANIGELLEKYGDTTDNKLKNTAASYKPVEIDEHPRLTDARPTVSKETVLSQPSARASPAPTRGTKRASDDFASADKENVSIEDLAMPKKRAKTTASMRVASGTEMQPSQILSPKSYNSRTLPHSPIRPAMAPIRSLLARPVSPLKPAAPAAAALASMVEKAKATRAAGRKPTPAASTSMTAGAAGTAAGGRAKRITTAPRPPLTVVQSVADLRGRTASNSSEASNLTTVITNKAKRAAPAKKGTTTGKVTGVGAAGKKVTSSVAKIEAPPADRRVLRKRN